MRHQVHVFGGLLAVAGVLALLLSPNAGSGQQQVVKPAKTEEIAQSRIAELQAKVAKLEKLLVTMDLIGDDKIAFGDMVGNLKEDRMNRYWRVKIVLKTDAKDRKAVAEMVNQKRSEMRSWVNQFMADETVQSFSGSKNQVRIREEMRKAFGEILSVDEKKNLITEVLFEDAVIQ